MSAGRSRHSRVWPLTALGTVVVIPIIAAAIYLASIGFWLMVRDLGEFLLWVTK